MTKETHFDHPPKGHVAILYYDVTNDRFQVVPCDDVDTAIPATAKATVASALAHGYDGTLWRKQPTIWGYTDRWYQDLSESAPSTGTWTKLSTAVPSDEVYKLEFIYVINDSRSGTAITFSAVVAGVTNYFVYDTTVARFYPNTFIGSITLKNGDQIRLTMDGVVQGDTMKACVWGSKMSIEM